MKPMNLALIMVSINSFFLCVIFYFSEFNDFLFVCISYFSVIVVRFAMVAENNNKLEDYRINKIAEECLNCIKTTKNYPKCSETDLCTKKE